MFKTAGISRQLLQRWVQSSLWSECAAFPHAREQKGLGTPCWPSCWVWFGLQALRSKHDFRTVCAYLDRYAPYDCSPCHLISFNCFHNCGVRVSPCLLGVQNSLGAVIDRSYCWSLYLHPIRQNLCVWMDIGDRGSKFIFLTKKRLMSFY